MSVGAARALVVVGLLLAAGAGWAQAASLASVRERGTFNICAHPDALPYSSQDRTTQRRVRPAWLWPAR